MYRNMSGLDGYEAFNQIINAGKNAKVVIITDYSENKPKNEKNLQQRVIAIISKPVGIDTLLDTVKKYSDGKQVLKNNI
jgi:DNA-binding NarL/FixJ family response regulator